MKPTLPALCLLSCLTSYAMPPDYKGQPYQKAQVIPGTLQCVLYDRGGEGLAYHDTGAVNEGSKLNHTSFLRGAKDGVGGVEVKHCIPGVPDSVCFFRENEGVDISYTKPFADFSHPNLVDPPRNQLYIGWTDDGEWTNYTVNVKRAGRYKVIALYSHQPNTIHFDIDGKAAAECKLPVETGDWHIWNKATIGEIDFSAPGLHVLTLHYNKGNNFATLDFVPVDAAKP